MRTRQAALPDMFDWIVIGIGMIAVGWLAWSLLKAQGHATPPTDTPPGRDGPDAAD